LTEETHVRGLFGRRSSPAGDITPDDVRAALRTVIEPDLHRDLISLGMVRDIAVRGRNVSFTVQLSAPPCALQPRLDAECRAALSAVDGVGKIDISFTTDIARDERIERQIGAPVRNVVAIASGKGGVGKSTMSTNLAIALAQEGARVGLMDADVYGPNIPQMMGAGPLPPPRNQRMITTESHGVRLMSMGFLVQPDQPVIWRGPMLHSALRQFLTDVEWGELDYLLIDLPPGTGDVQMTLAQSVPITGSVLVTTPQSVALSDVRKGAMAFRTLEVPILGLVENMSYFIAPDTGRRYDIFGHGGGERYAREIGIPFLGRVPLDPRIVEGGDAGQPIVVAQPSSEAAQSIRRIACDIAAHLSVLNRTRKPEGVIGAADIPIMG
jgi:ATP-binding protein involved in chromosome partitioning